MEFQANSLEEMRPVAREIISRMKERHIVLLEGEMGSGKTTLVSLIMQEMGVKSDVSSPTYSIVQEYERAQGPVFHFDLYRIEKKEELLDLGFEEYLDSGFPCLIEWPSLARGLIDSPALEVHIQVTDQLRSVRIG